MENFSEEYFETIFVNEGNDLEMAADVFGDGDSIILIHGIPGGPEAWHKVAAKLSQSFKVVVPHLFGFKDSSKPKTHTELWADSQAMGILEVCKKLRINDAVLVGHDFGGPVAAKLTELKPNYWSHLALFSTNTFSDAPIPPPLSFTVLPIIGKLFQILLFSKPSLAMMLRQGVSRPGISLDKSVYLGNSQQVHSIATIFSYALENLDSLYQPIERVLSDYKRPSLVGWGDKDPFFSVDQGRRTADLVNGVFSLYKDAGHFTPEECVDEVVEDLQKLIK